MSYAETMFELAREEFRLKQGDRITISSVEACGCNQVRARTGEKRCHMCRGVGWIIDAKTLRADNAEQDW